MRADEICGGKDIEMEGESGAGKMEALGDIAGGKALRGVADEETEDVQARFLSEGGEGVDGLRCFHSSRRMEMIDEVPPCVKEGRFCIDEEPEGEHRRDAEGAEARGVRRRASRLTGVPMTENMRRSGARIPWCLKQNCA